MIPYATYDFYDTGIMPHSNVLFMTPCPAIIISNSRSLSYS